MHKKIEVGNIEKHTVEYISNPYTGIEEVWVDGQQIFRHFCLFGMDKEFEIGGTEKLKLRINSGFLEQLSINPLFFVNGEPALAPNIDARSRLNQAVLMVGSIAGAAVGYYSGVSFLFLALTWGILGAVLLKILKGHRPQAVVLLLSGQMTYVLWLTMALFMTKSISIVPDMLVFAALTIWLAVKPGKAVFTTITAFQGFGAALNTLQLFALPFGSTEHKGLVSHFVIRFCIIIVALVVFLDTNKKRGTPP